MAPPKVHNSLVSDSKDIKVALGVPGNRGLHHNNSYTNWKPESCRETQLWHSPPLMTGVKRHRKPWAQHCCACSSSRQFRSSLKSPVTLLRCWEPSQSSPSLPFLLAWMVEDLAWPALGSWSSVIPFIRPPGQSLWESGARTDVLWERAQSSGLVGFDLDHILALHIPLDLGHVLKQESLFSNYIKLSNTGPTTTVVAARWVSDIPGQFGTALRKSHEYPSLILKTTPVQPLLHCHTALKPLLLCKINSDGTRKDTGGIRCRHSLEMWLCACSYYPLHGDS